MYFLYEQIWINNLLKFLKVGSVLYCVPILILSIRQSIKSVPLQIKQAMSFIKRRYLDLKIVEYYKTFDVAGESFFILIMKTCQIYRYSVARSAVLKATTEIFDGKITSSYEYRLTSRSGVGIINISTSKRNGCVVASFVVDLDLKIPNQ